MPQEVEHIASKYFRLPFCDELEALSVVNHKTSFPAHFHPTFNITLVYNGSFHTELGDRSIFAPSGSILITNPEEIHANPIGEDGHVSFFTFYIGKEFLEYCHHKHPVTFQQKTINDPFLFSGLHDLSMRVKTDHDNPVQHADFLPVLHYLAIHYGSETMMAGERKQKLFQEFLSEDHSDKFSLTETAKRFGMDKYKFIRLFKYQTGLTPNNYFIYRRIEKSKRLLGQGRDLMSIAIDLGFYDSAHFCNNFKKFTGVSPLVYTAGK